ncbi:hypothetical protein KFL_010860050, partial [Klebsormidium nitens]
MMPGSNNAYDVGASSNAWKNVYAGSATLSGSVAANGATNNAFDVGSSSNAWKNLYAATATLSGPLSANGATLSAPLALGSNAISTTGSISSSSNRVATLYSGTVDSGTLKANSNLTLAVGSTTSISTDMMPGSNNAYDMGASSNAWKNVYAGSATLSGSLAANGATLSGPLALGSNSISTTGTIASSSNRATALYSGTVDSGTLRANSNLTLGAGSTTSLSADVLPGSNNAYDLGSSTGAWKSLYAGSATLSGSLSASGASLSAPLSMGGNAVYTTGTVSSSSNRASVVYSTSVDAGSLTVNSNASIAGALTCYSLNTQNSNLNAGSGSISGGAISGTSASLSGQLTCKAVDTQGCNISAGAINGGAFVGTSMSVGTGSVSGGAGSFSGDVTVSGKLLVGGSIDYISTSELLVADKHVTLAATSNPTDATASGAGLYVQGSNYAASNATLSFTWNQGCNGNYWLPKGGNLALPGTAGSKMVTLSTTSNGALQLLSDDGTSATSTALVGVSLIASGSNLDLGSTSNAWSTLYASNVGTSAKRVATIYASSVDAGAGAFGSNVGVTGSLVAANGLTSSNGLTVSSGTLTLPASSVVNAAITSGLDATKITTGTFGVGAFGGCNISTTGTLGAGPSTLSTVSCTTLTTNNSNLTVGTVSLPASSVVNAAIASGLDATKITTGTFGVGAFGACNISTTGTLGAGASTLGTLSCTTITTNNSNLTLGSGGVTSGQLNPTTTATYDLGASGTAWKNAYLSGTVSAAGGLSTSNGLVVAGESIRSYTTSFDSTTSNACRDIAQYVGSVGSATFVISVVQSASSQTNTTEYSFAAGYNMTSGAWQRCMPRSAYNGNADACELQIWSSVYTIKFRLVHSGVSQPATPTVTIHAFYNQSDVPTITSLTANAQYTDASWATYAYATSTVLTQTGGKVGVGTAAPSAKFHVSNGSAQFDSNVTVTSALSTSNFTATGTVSLPTSCVTNANISSVDASKITSGTFGAGAFGACNISTTGTLGAGSSTLGTLSCTTVTSGQHNPTTAATYDLGASATAWRSAYLSSNLTAGGSITASNGLTVSSGSVSLPAGSVGNAALASGLNATKITTGTFGVGDFGGCNISTTGTLNAGYSTLGDISCGSLSLSGTTLIDASLSAYNSGHDIGKAQDMSSVFTPDSSDMTWNDVHITGGVNIYASDPGYFLSLDYLNNDTYGFGQWSGGTARAVFSGSNANATFNISKPTGASTFDDMVTVTSSGNMGLGVSPSTTYKLDVAGRMHATSGAQFDSNVTVSGTLSATTYSGLQRKVWNASTLGFANTTNTVKYHKIATFGGTNAGNTAGSVYITGTMGGYISNQTTKVEIDIANRGGITITGSAFGYPSTTSTITDLVLYWEGSSLATSPWSLYIVSKGQSQCRLGECGD